MEALSVDRSQGQLNDAIAAGAASIGRLISHARLADSRYPYFPLTFSLWRSDKYEEITMNLVPENKHKAALQFHQAVDYELLDQFTRKVEQSIVECFNGLKTPESLKLKQLVGQNDELVQEYSRAAARQLTALELFVDLTTMPYAIPIKETLRIRKEFAMEAEAGGSSLTDLVSIHGQDVAFKGLGKIGTELCNKFIVGLTTIIGGINLAGLAGGLAVSKLFEMANGKLNEKKIVERLRHEVTVFQTNSQFLQEHYRLCRKMLLQYLKSSSTEDRKVVRNSYVELLREVFTIEYEEFVVLREVEGGWNTVELRDNEQFEEL